MGQPPIASGRSFLAFGIAGGWWQRPPRLPNVRSWHKADVTRTARDVRSQFRSGHGTQSGKVRRPLVGILGILWDFSLSHSLVSA